MRARPVQSIYAMESNHSLKGTLVVVVESVVVIVTTVLPGWAVASVNCADKLDGPVYGPSGHFDRHPEIRGGKKKAQKPAI